MIAKGLKRVKRLLASGYHNRKLNKWETICKQGDPVDFALPDGSMIKLYPEGHIPELLYVGGFEYTELLLSGQFLKPGMNVLDIGANVGLYSTLSSLKVGADGTVWCFEPSSETAERLRRNLKLNNCSNVKVTQKALSSTDGGCLILKRDPGFRDGDRYLTPKDESCGCCASGCNSGDTEEVPIATLDAWRATELPAQGRIDFLKMDVEGGEFDVLKGAKETLTTNHNIVLMFECTPTGCARAGHTQNDVFKYLRELGFGLYCFDEKYKNWKSDDASLLDAGNVWATRDASRLPRG